MKVNFLSGFNHLFKNNNCIDSLFFRWPNQGCCKFSDSLAYERQAAKKLANQGLLKKRVPPPSCSLLDIFDGEYKPFLSTHNKQYATAVLFWTPWYVWSVIADEGSCPTL